MDTLANSTDSDAAISSLLHPARLWSATEILRSFASVPKSAGVYAWYFDEVPPGVPTAGCHRSSGGQVLLYVGIAPKEAKTTTTPSARTIRHRLREAPGRASTASRALSRARRTPSCEESPFGK